MAGAMNQLQSVGVSTPGMEGGEGLELRKEVSWKKFFKDPSKWWDNRSTKRSTTQPDFKHKLTREPLWIDSRDNPPWVSVELTRRGFAIQNQGLRDSSNPSSADPPLLSLIWACSKNKDLTEGIRIHNELHKRGLIEKNYTDALVTMYSRCGELQKAQTLLDMHNCSNIIPWNAIMAGYNRVGQGQIALDCSEKLQREGVSPNPVTYACILKACAATGAIDKGKKIHDEISRQGLLKQDRVLGNALVDMYAKCGALSQAQSVLEKLHCRDVVSWNTLITGYSQQRQGQRALECFEQMQQEGIPPDRVTYACLLKACAAIGAIEKGKQIHEEISMQGLLKHDVVLGGALVDMYAKCGALTLAQRVLKKLPTRNVVSWSALITGYAQKGQGQQALECFEQMQRESVPPDETTYLCILKACAVIGAIDKGKQIHDEILRQGFLEHNILLGNALVDMYAKCGALPQAQSVLEKLCSRDVVSWNALISGYAQNGQGQQALACFEQMHCEGIPPDVVTYASTLKACAVIGAIDKGKKIHDDMSRQGLLEHDIVLGNALVDMYAKCGALQQAQSVLEGLPFRDIVSWNALIAGYAQEGQSEQAIKSFEQMQQEAILPDLVTFICLLNMCSHLGLVEKGQELFDSMGATFGLEPDIECFTCMVDLLGRAGHLLKAVEVIQEMHVSTNSTIWLCLLGACRKWVDVNAGIWAFEHAVKLDKFNGAGYILMADLYAAVGMPEKAKDIEAMRIKNTAWKE